MNEIQGTFTALWNDGEGSTSTYTRSHYGEYKNAYNVDIHTGKGGQTVYRVKVKDLFVGDKVFVEGRKTPVLVETMQDTYTQESKNYDTGETKTFNMVRFNSDRNKVGAMTENTIVQILAIKKIGAGYGK